jgi:TctA family transporter
MSNIFAVAGVVSAVYFILKFIEMRYIEKEPKPLKYLVRDCLVVYLSVVVGHFILEQAKPIMNLEGGSNVAPPVFTGNPEF